jgi:hypothetical protein
MRKNRDNRVCWRCINCGITGIAHMNPKGELFKVRPWQIYNTENLSIIDARCYPNCAKISIVIPPGTFIMEDGAILIVEGT